MSNCNSDFITYRRKGTWRTYDGTNGLPGPVLAICQDRGRLPVVGPHQQPDQPF
jgi:hypothetical protein